MPEHVYLGADGRYRDRDRDRDRRDVRENGRGGDRDAPRRAAEANGSRDDDKALVGCTTNTRTCMPRSIVVQIQSAC